MEPSNLSIVTYGVDGNTSTGLFTEPMLDAICRTARRIPHRTSATPGLNVSPWR